MDKANLDKRFMAARKMADRLTVLRETAHANRERTRDELNKCSENIVVLTKTGDVLKHLLETILLEEKKPVEELVSTGLQTIFYDQKLSFEALVEQRGGRLEFDLSLKSGAEEATIQGDPLEAFGGGPATITSLILRVLTLRRLNRAPILLLDETFGAISEEYTEQTGIFMRKLCESLGIDLLLVTHNPAFLNYANVGFQVSEGTEGDETYLTLKKL